MALLGDIYSEGEQQDKAEEYYRKSVSLQPENPYNINYLARFLIDKDRNIKEGLDLIEKALEISPDNFSFLTTKGCGLYKQGKYKEALETLEKSWELKPVYSHRLYLALEEAKKAVN
jgi:tetratricopeptide (TPR) repeat protein